MCRVIHWIDGESNERNSGAGRQTRPAPAISGRDDGEQIFVKPSVLLVVHSHAEACVYLEPCCGGELPASTA